MKLLYIFLSFSLTGLTVYILPAQISVFSERPYLIHHPTEVTIIPIGTSANAFGWGFSGGQMTYLWAEPSLNMVANIHRMGGALDPDGFSGDIGYDISTNRGETWQNQLEIYTAVNIGGTPAGSVIPQCTLFNPPGNTNPGEAYIPFFSHLYISGLEPLMVQGRGKTGDPEDTTAHYISSPFYPYIITETTGYSMTTAGDIWAAGILMDTAYGGYYYAGYLGVFHGIWNDESLDFDFSTIMLPCETFKNFLPQDVKVAFAPDGITGWIGVIADNGAVPISTCESYFPILWKTNDAGASWEGPVTAAIAGPNGLMDIQNYFSDAELQQLFGLPLPPRDDIEFTTAYDFDLHVDFAGNPHIAVVVGITGLDMYTMVTEHFQGYPNQYMLYMLATDIYLDNDEWKVHILGRLQNFRGSFGTEVYEDNRIQIASTSNGQYMFVSWLDTDIPGYYENNQPNIFCRGISCVDQRITYPNGEDRPYNVTAYTAGMWQAYCHSMAHYVFEDAGGNLFTIEMKVIKAQEINFVIKNLNGQQVVSFPSVFCQPGKFTTSMDIPELAEGVYFIGIMGEVEGVVRKLMVHH